jgi:hypothetical protein
MLADAVLFARALGPRLASVPSRSRPAPRKS